MDYWSQNLDPIAAEDGAAAAYERRRLHISKLIGGMGVLDGTFDAVG